MFYQIPTGLILELTGPLLKGSWNLVTTVIIRVTRLITPIKVLITLLTKSHDPPSMRCQRYRGVLQSKEPAMLQDNPTWRIMGLRNLKGSLRGSLKGSKGIYRGV